jgi:hypothetical protein
MMGQVQKYQGLGSVATSSSAGIRAGIKLYAQRGMRPVSPLSQCWDGAGAFQAGFVTCLHMGYRILALQGRRGTALVRRAQDMSRKAFAARAQAHLCSGSRRAAEWNQSRICWIPACFI